MPESLENSAVATGLKKVNFQSNPKERQFQTIFKLPHNCTHLTRYQSNAQNSPIQKAENFQMFWKWSENFRMFKLDLEKAEEPEIKLPASIGS